jgi:hypothetical protein
MDGLERILVVDADGHVNEGDVDISARLPEPWRSQGPVSLKDNLPEPNAVKAARSSWAREAAPEGALR